MEVKRNVGAFQPIHREKTVEKSVQSVRKANASATSTSTTESGSRGEGANNGNTNSKKEEKEGQPQRKQRRSWSPELHRRFLHALQQFGGPHGELFVKLFFIIMEFVSIMLFVDASILIGICLQLPRQSKLRS